MITMEKIDYVMNMTKAPYSIVRTALLDCDGDVDRAIEKISNEYENITGEDEKEKKVEFHTFEEIKNAIREIWEKGNATKLIVEKNGENILSLPLTVSAIGLILAPFASLVGTGVVLIDDFDFKIIMKDGKIIDIKEYINLNNPFKKQNNKDGHECKECSEDKSESEENK